MLSLLGTGTLSEVKRKFSKVAVIEVIPRQGRVNGVEYLSSIQGIERVISSSHGPLQKLAVYVLPNSEIKEKVARILSQNNIESIVMRDPTLEEAYISILK